MLLYIISIQYWKRRRSCWSCWPLSSHGRSPRRSSPPPPSRTSSTSSSRLNEERLSCLKCPIRCRHLCCCCCHHFKLKVSIIIIRWWNGKEWMHQLLNTSIIKFDLFFFFFLKHLLYHNVLIHDGMRVTWATAAGDCSRIQRWASEESIDRSLMRRLLNDNNNSNISK